MVGSGIRVLRNLSAGSVAAIAAWSSYSHMVHVALRFGERPEVAYALPFSVDGMLLVATVVMVDDKDRRTRVRPIVRLAFTAGVLASVAANIAAAHPSAGARIVAAWPAVALLLVVEMLARAPAAEAQPVPIGVSMAEPPSPPTQVPAEPHPSAVTVAPGGADQAPAELPPSPPIQAPAELPPSPPGHVAAEPHRSANALTLVGGDLPAQYRRPPASAVPNRRSAAIAAGGSPRVAITPPDGDMPAVRSRARRGGDAFVPVEPALAPPAGSGLRMRRNLAPTDGADAVTVSQAHQGGVAGRRPAATTRQLAWQLLEAEPGITRTEVAARLGVSTRRLREVLATQ